MPDIPLTWWPLLILSFPVYWLYTLIVALIHFVIRAMSMGDMLIDIMIVHSSLHRRRPVRVPQPTILPPELWNAILAQCQDRSALLACSLVCRTLASISREHLQIQLSLDARARTTRFGHLLRSPVQTLSQMADCTRFSGQDYGQHRRVVRLLHFRGAKIRSAIFKGNIRAVPLLIRYYPDIIDLTFECDSHDAVPGQVILVEEYSKFLSQVSCFNSLCSLSINFDYAHPPQLSDSEPPGTLPITQLSVHGVWCSGLGSWVQKRCKRLKTLVLLPYSGWCPNEAASVEIVLRANAATLRHLDLTVPGPLNLSVVKDLRSLLLKLHIGWNLYPFGNVIRTLQSLDPLRSPRNVYIQPATQRHEFTDEQIAALAEVMAKLGLLREENERCTLSYIDLGSRV